MPTSLDPFLSRTRIAYFSMEIAIQPDMHTYSGGLGVLAGDTARSAADLALPMVFVTLVSRAGYFRQEIDVEGRQSEGADDWEPADFCEPLDVLVGVPMGDHPVWVRPWLKVVTCPLGNRVPILLLDTNIEQNAPEDRAITDHLYGGDQAYRLKQEIVLGIGGYRALRALGFEIATFHLNEGHAALLTLELMNGALTPREDRREGEAGYDAAAVRKRCVFTTHTPVAAGHDQFPHELVDELLPGYVDGDALKHLAGTGSLNMTRLALNLSGYVNGVARRHAQTTEKMFPGYRIHAVTNGVHVGTWAHESFARLFDRSIPHWRHEPEMLVRAFQLSDEDLADCHGAARRDLVGEIDRLTGRKLDAQAFTIGFARRMTGYKRPLLLFQDVERLRAMAKDRPLQIVLAGKAHPRDTEGKEAIREVHEIARGLEGQVTCIFVPGYDMRIAKYLVSGVDVWLNNPLPPMEASGTSGMKAALNGVLNFSVLDGWWIEACVEGVTGWAIGEDDEASRNGHHAEAIYDKLESTILPLFYDDPAAWRAMMKHSIGSVACYFNSQRMMRRYASEAYLR